ncbi:MAG: arginine--tRNA ligase [SAR324 cluster bacterium]|nr:arginine--tRNA ligase [SAR324 cluster bacterium]
MNIFKKKIGLLLHSALQQVSPEQETTLPENLEKLIENPPKPEMGDYAFPCFTLAKSFRKAPNKIAEELSQILAASLTGEKEVIAVQALGPYINFSISTSLMASLTLPQMINGSYFEENKSGDSERVMIEFSQPNTHKGFHVGHMRNVALGDSLCRIFRYNGDEVIASNYIGDVGAHIAKCLWFYMNHNQESAPDHLRGEWLGELYMKAIQKLESSSPEEAALFQSEISRILKHLEEKEPELSKIWEKTRQWSMEDFKTIYHWLDVKFDHFFYESQVDESGKKLVLEEFEKGTFIRSEGAIGIDLGDVELGFFLLLKSDNNTLYSTKDLALAKKKFDEFQIERSIYVVGAEQTLHFRQVFETLKRMGYAQANQCFHLSYGLVALPSGKMSSRSGNVILFSQLQEEMNSYIQNNYLNRFRGEWTEEEIEETTRRVAVAAIKYGMLNQDPNKQIVFAMEDWLVSEGDTGTYLIYAYVRIRSIARQVERSLSVEVDFGLLCHPNEHALIRLLYDFNDVVQAAGDQHRPSILARMLFDLAKTFSRAYQTCSVKHAESAELQSARLLLFHCVAETLKHGLILLGITPPERM